MKACGLGRGSEVALASTRLSRATVRDTDHVFRRVRILCSVFGKLHWTDGKITKLTEMKGKIKSVLSTQRRGLYLSIPRKHSRTVSIWT